MKREIVKKTVEAIGQMISDRLDELEDYEFEPGGCDELDDASMSVTCQYGNAEVECNVWWHGYKASIECFIYPSNDNHVLENLEKAVCEWLQKNLDTDSLFEAIKESVSDGYEDEWDSHGFRDEADYLHYRYG